MKISKIDAGIKFKMARLLLGVSQADIAKHTELTQRDISQLENGKKIFVPTSYIQYMNKMKIDLNSLFDASNEVRFSNVESLNSAKMTSEGYVPNVIQVSFNEDFDKILRGNKISQFNGFTDALKEKEEFHFCQRTDCTLKGVNKKCYQISNELCASIVE
jgi:transcriptional regulator with XRE-family HTH domain